MLQHLFQECSTLQKLILRVPHNPELLSCCVHYDAVDKIILENSNRLQLRLHIYSDRLEKVNASSQIDTAEAHNHRWNFTSLILSGGYRHTIYKIDHDQGHLRMSPLMIRQESKGSIYALHHSQFHSICEQPNAVTLLIRGPHEKENFQLIQEKDGVARLQEISTLEEKSRRVMDQSRYSQLLKKLKNLHIID